MSFHYFFSEIDYFLTNVKNIKSESDYRDFINQTNNNNFFINVERFLYQNLEASGLENFGGSYSIILECHLVSPDSLGIAQQRL
jgi:hypothetical protein